MILRRLCEYDYAECAAKCLKESQVNAEMIHEGELFKDVSSHPYIVQFFGVYEYENIV